MHDTDGDGIITLAEYRKVSRAVPADALLSGGCPKTFVPPATKFNYEIKFNGMQVEK